jgi:ribonuclease BN (tRNA processing enzyme)
LTNDGDLEIFFLGVGNAGTLDHYQTSIIIIKGDTHVLVDFGMYGPLALRHVAGLALHDVGVFLPTHSHADHIGGVELMALHNRYFATRVLKKPKLNMVITPEYQRILWDCSLRGGLEWNEEQEDGRRKLSFGDYFNTIKPTWKTAQPREIHEVTIGDLTLELFRTNHIPEQADDWEASFVSYGLFIDGRIFYSADTQFDHELLNLYKRDADYFFHDVQFFPGAVHAPLDDLMTLPEEIRNSMFLTHYADSHSEFNTANFLGLAQQGSRYIF